MPGRNLVLKNGVDRAGGPECGEPALAWPGLWVTWLLHPQMSQLSLQLAALSRQTLLWGTAGLGWPVVSLAMVIVCAGVRRHEPCTDLTCDPITCKLNGREGSDHTSPGAPKSEGPSHLLTPASQACPTCCSQQTFQKPHPATSTDPPHTWDGDFTGDPNAVTSCGSQMSSSGFRETGLSSWAGLQAREPGPGAQVSPA